MGGANIALELQRVAKPKLWQRIAQVFTGTDYAQQNIDKAVANFEKSSILYKNAKNLPEELKKEEQARAAQKQDKGINIAEKKSQIKQKPKAISLLYQLLKNYPTLMLLMKVDRVRKNMGPHDHSLQIIKFWYYILDISNILTMSNIWQRL